MDFLATFSPDARKRLLDIADRRELDAGERLLRTGEPGGDVYLVEQGGLEVYNSRVQPEVILANLPQGALVGELSFLDDSPRSADVRADRPTTVLHWPRDELRALLDRDEGVASAFYGIVARQAAERLRGVSGGNDLVAPAAAQERDERAQRDARKLARSIADDLLAIETQLRQDRDAEGARRRMQSLLSSLEGRLAELFDEHGQPGAADAAAEVVVESLRPWLVRSALAERCLRRPQGRVVTPEVLAHVLFNTESGDGLGRALDRWLLDRPSMSALRQLVKAVSRRSADRMPDRGARRVLVVGAGTGSIAGELQGAMRERGGTLTVIDRRSSVLESIGGARARTPKVALRTQVVDLAAFATGRHLPDLARQDVIAVHTIFEYLPDRLVVGFARALQYYLAPGGHLVLGGLTPSRDAALFRHVLGWSTVRRTGPELARLVASGGLQIEDTHPLRGPAVVVTAISGR